MSVARVSAVVTLVVSLGANAFFAQALGRRPAPAEQPADEEEAPAAATPSPPTSPVPAVRPTASGKSPGSGGAAGGGAVTFQQAQCAGQLANLQESIAQKSEALRGVLPAQPLFARGQPNPEAERLMTPIVAQVLAKAGAADGKPTVECKDVACKLVFTAPASIDDDALDQALATNGDFQGWSQQFTLGPAAPVKDPGAKPGLVQRSVFFKLNGPKAVAAQEALASGSGRH